MGMFDFLGQSGGKSSSTPWAPQADQLKTGFNQANDWLTNVNNNPNPDISAGRDMQRDNAMQGFGGAIDNQNYVSNFFSDPAMLDPNSNPYLQANIDTLGFNVTEQMNRNNNTINQQAAQAGAYGGGRQGVAQGLNAESANEAFSQGTNRMLMDNYNQRLSQMQGQQQFLNQQAQLNQLPGMVLENLGLAEQNQPMDNLERFWSIVASNNWGGDRTQTNQASPLTMLGQLNDAKGLFA